MRFGRTRNSSCAKNARPVVVGCALWVSNVSPCRARADAAGRIAESPQIKIHEGTSEGICAVSSRAELDEAALKIVVEGADPSATEFTAELERVRAFDPREVVEYLIILADARPRNAPRFSIYPSKSISGRPLRPVPLSGRPEWPGAHLGR